MLQLLMRRWQSEEEMRRDIRTEAPALEQQARDYAKNPEMGFTAGYDPGARRRIPPLLSAGRQDPEFEEFTAADWLRAIVRRDFPGARVRVVPIAGNDAELEFL